MSFAELKNLLNSSDLSQKKPKIELTYIYSPMRTLSTVLLPALLQFTDGIMSEPMHPFNRSQGGLDGGCRGILNYIHRRIENNPSRPILRIVCKDMSHIVTPEEFDSLAEITTNFLFTVREPRMQIRSSIQAFQHDLDNNNFSSEDEKIRRAESLSIHYNTLAYNNLEDYLKRAKSLAPDRTIVVSSLATKLDPVGVLRAIADKFQWPYETVENRWTPLEPVT